jgi:putative spermidine/putrescine transport system ATP-binding protein
MDEPLGALDKKLRDRMQLEIKHLHTELGITVLYVTHDQEEAMIMSDRICLMNEGRIEQMGSAAELYFRPRTLFAADFLGESNLLDATVAGLEGGVLVLHGPGGATVRAPAAPGVATGDRVKLVVRPERLALLGPGEDAANVLDGVLRDVILVGGVTKYYVALGDGRTVSATRLTAGPPGPLAPNAKARVGWAIDSAVALPA